MTGKHFLYFAYGSNMLTSRLKAEDRAPSARPLATGYLPGRTLDFSKAGADRSGKCDIPESCDSECRVYGIVYEVHQRHRKALDRVEELGWGYREETVSIQTSSEVIDALTYIAIRRKPGILPFHWYKSITIAGALEHGLPGEYIDKIRAFESMTDPDPERNALHKKLLGHNFATFDH